MYLIQTVSSRPRAWSSHNNVSISHDHLRGVHSMNSVEELPTYLEEKVSYYSPKFERKTVAATTYDFPEGPPQPKKDKKWSLGSLFRRKKKDETESSSDEESKKTFLNRRKRKAEKKRNKKLVGGFDHIVLSNNRLSKNGYYDEGGGVLSDPTGGFAAYSARPLPRLPLNDVNLTNTQRMNDSQSQISRASLGSADSLSNPNNKKVRKDRAKLRAEARRENLGHTSSDEDSQRSVSSSRIRSDENLFGKREGSFSRRSRAARTERYIRRLSKDEDNVMRSSKSDAEPVHHPNTTVRRWRVKDEPHTPSPNPNLNHQNQPPRTKVSPITTGLSTIPPPSHTSRSSSSSFGNNKPPQEFGNNQPQSLDTLSSQRSLSYDSNININKNVDGVLHVQLPVRKPNNRFRNLSLVEQPRLVTMERQPPPPPPRDPKRVVQHAESLGNRPVSTYYADTNNRFLKPKSNSLNWHPGYRSTSEDHLTTTRDINLLLTPRPSSVDEAQNHHHQVRKRELNDFQYLADRHPRSRKPIFIQNNEDGDLTKNAQNFWRRKDQEVCKSPHERLLQLQGKSSPSSSSSSKLHAHEFNFNHSPSQLNTQDFGNFGRSNDNQDQNQNQDLLHSQNNRLSRKSSSYSPQMFTAQTQVRTNIFLPSVVRNDVDSNNSLHTLHPKDDSVDVVDFARDSSPFMPISPLSKSSTSSLESKTKPSDMYLRFDKYAKSSENLKNSPEAEAGTHNFDNTTLNKNRFGKISQNTNNNSLRDSKHGHHGHSHSHNHSESPGTNKFNFDSNTNSNVNEGMKFDVFNINKTNDKRSESRSKTPTPSRYSPQSQSSTTANSYSPSTFPARYEKYQESKKKNDKMLNNEINNVEKPKETEGRKSSNLEDALDELEAIYQSLHLGDEDLLERAEQREMSMANQKLLEKNVNESYPGWVMSRGAMSDSSYSYEPFDSIDSPRKKRILKKNRFDRKTDDMAFRKLNKERSNTINDPQSVISKVSYLLASPVHGMSAEDAEREDRKEATQKEPDITLDDVVYRNIKHANNTLKVSEPQPPFGIPIGPITAGSNSDYLHAVPENSPRYHFKNKKIPDIVKDDLAFRNLRKDSNKAPSLPNSQEELEANLNALKKKRAVRSLSANISNLIQRNAAKQPNGKCKEDDPRYENEFYQPDLDEIADAMEIARQILKEKDNRITNTRRAFLSDTDATRYGFKDKQDLNEAKMNLLNGIRNASPEDSDSVQQKIQVYIPFLGDDYLDSKPPRGLTPDRKVKESTPTPRKIESDNYHSSLEELLSALEVEARETTQRINNELTTLNKDTDKEEEESVEVDKKDQVKVESQSNSVEKENEESKNLKNGCSLEEDVNGNQFSLEKSLNDIEGVSEHAKLCEKLLGCVAESTKLMSSKTEVLNEEEVESLEPLVKESKVNIVLTPKSTQELNRKDEPDYENFQSEAEVRSISEESSSDAKPSKSPFEEHKAELIAGFQELNKIEDVTTTRKGSSSPDDHEVGDQKEDQGKAEGESSVLCALPVPLAFVSTPNKPPTTYMSRCELKLHVTPSKTHPDTTPQTFKSSIFVVPRPDKDNHEELNNKSNHPLKTEDLNMSTLTVLKQLMGRDSPDSLSTGSRRNSESCQSSERADSEFSSGFHSERSLREVEDMCKQTLINAENQFTKVTFEYDMVNGPDSLKSPKLVLHSHNKLEEFRKSQENLLCESPKPNSCESGFESCRETMLSGSTTPFDEECEEDDNNRPDLNVEHMFQSKADHFLDEDRDAVINQIAVFDEFQAQNFVEEDVFEDSSSADLENLNLFVEEDVCSDSDSIYFDCTKDESTNIQKQASTSSSKFYDENFNNKKKCDVNRTQNVNGRSNGNDENKMDKTSVWYKDPVMLAIACSYGFACTYQLASLDVVAILGLIFVILSFVSTVLDFV